MRKAVFFDRDGVLNEAVILEGRPYPPRALSELRIYPDARECVLRLRAARLLTFVVTNQPDVRRGTQDRGVALAIADAIAAVIPVDEFLTCWHDDADNCECRKPKPGLLLDAATRYDLDLGASFMVGDRWRDIDAGAAAGCRTVLIDRSYSERKPSHEPDFITSDLRSAVDWIFGITAQVT